MLIKSKSWIITNIIVFGILLISFIGMHYYTYRVNSEIITYEMGSGGSSYDFRLNVSKSWGEEAHGYNYGMQYDAEVANLTDYELHDWTAEIQFVDGCYVDSYWNGEVIFADNKLVLTPMDYNNIVEPHKSRTFGFILYGPTVDANVISAKLLLGRNMNIRDLPYYWVVIILAAIMLVVDITVFIMDIKNLALVRRQKMLSDVINQSFLTFSNMIDAKDPYTRGHSHRVAIYSKRIAQKMGLSENDQWDLFHIALLHDIGKIGIPDSVLKKPGKLNSEERNEIEKHVTIGGDILKDFNAIKWIESGARYHHERYDGKGYAEGLNGKNIPLFARIIGVADAFDAMSSARCYRPKMPIEYIEEELKKCSGTQFDPEIVPYLLEMIKDGEAPVEVE